MDGSCDYSYSDFESGIGMYMDEECGPCDGCPSMEDGGDRSQCAGCKQMRDVPLHERHQPMPRRLARGGKKRNR